MNHVTVAFNAHKIDVLLNSLKAKQYLFYVKKKKKKIKSFTLKLCHQTLNHQNAVYLSYSNGEKFYCEIQTLIVRNSYCNPQLFLYRYTDRQELVLARNLKS